MFGFLKRKEIVSETNIISGYKEDGTIDFNNKKLNLVHLPRIQGTVTSNATINEKGEALINFRKSFLPSEIEKEQLLEFSRQTLKTVNNGNTNKIETLVDKKTRRSRKIPSVKKRVGRENI